MQIYPSRYPWRETFLTSYYITFQSKWSAKDKRILTIFILATGAKVR